MNRPPIQTRPVLITVCIALIAVMAAVSGLNTALPDIAVDTGATQTQLTWIVDAYTVVFAGLLLLAGALGDRFGRRRVLLVGLAVFAVTSAVGLASHSAEFLISLRALSGLGAALIMPSTLSVITTSFPPAERSRAVGVWVGVAGGGAVIGLFATALLLERFAWNSFFALTLTISIAGLLGTWRYVPESRDDDRRLDWVGGGLSVAAIGSLVLGIIEAGNRGWSDDLTLSALVAGTLALIAFVLVELRVSQPLLDPRHFRDRGFSVGSLSVSVQFFAQLGLVYVVVQYLQLVVGLSALDAALRLLPMAVIVIPASQAAGALEGRIPSRYIGAAGLALLALGLWLFTHLTSDFDLWRFWLALSVYALGVALSATPATTWITRALPDADQGVASAVNDAAREAGSAVGIAVLGSALTATYRDQIAPATRGLPADLAHQVEAGLSFTRLPAPPGQGDAWARLTTAAHDAFVTGMTDSLTIAAITAAATALIVLIAAPKAAPTPQRNKPRMRVRSSELFSEPPVGIEPTT